MAKYGIARDYDLPMFPRANTPESRAEHDAELRALVDGVVESAERQGIDPAQVEVPAWWNSPHYRALIPNLARFF